MLDFRKGTNRRKLPSVREQARWFWMLMLVGVGLILLNQVSKPETWRLLALWLAGRDRSEAGDVPGGPPIDNRLDSVADRKLPSDGFVSPPGGLKKGSWAPQSSGPHVGSLHCVRDDTPLISDDNDVWLRLLGTIQKSDDATLEKQSMGRVTYAQLFEQPDAYRGQAITVRGTVRRVHRLKAPANEFGIEEYYQAWLWTSDNPSSPMIVCCLALPEQFPLGMDVAEEVEATGLYFKRSVYQAADTWRTSPTLLGRSLRWRPQSQQGSEGEQGAGGVIGALLLAVFGVAALGMLAAVWMTWRTGPSRPSGPSVALEVDRLRQMESEAASRSESSGTVS